MWNLLRKKRKVSRDLVALIAENQRLRGQIAMLQAGQESSGHVGSRVVLDALEAWSGTTAALNGRIKELIVLEAPHLVGRRPIPARAPARTTAIAAIIESMAGWRAARAEVATAYGAANWTVPSAFLSDEVTAPHPDESSAGDEQQVDGGREP